MSEKFTVYLPQAAADKLASLTANPSEAALVLCLATYLAAACFSGVGFAMAPPAATTVGGSPVVHLNEIRIDIAIATSRIAVLIDGYDPDADVLIEALNAYRLKLECYEEAVITAAAVEGVVIDRRPDADPRAILGVVEVAPIATAAAA